MSIGADGGRTPSWITQADELTDVLRKLAFGLVIPLWLVWIMGTPEPLSAIDGAGDTFVALGRSLGPIGGLYLCIRMSEPGSVIDTLMAKIAPADEDAGSEREAEPEPSKRERQRRVRELERELDRVRRSA